MTDKELLTVLWAMTRGHGQCWRPLQYDREGGRVIAWIGADDHKKYQRLVPGLGYHHDLELGPVPYLRRGSFLLAADATCLWARVDTGDQLARLRRFGKGPTLVLREGATVRHVAFWALRKAIAPDRAEHAVRKLQHALFAPKKYATTGFTFRPPGGMIRGGRQKAVAVSAVFVNDDAEYFAGRLVQGLREPPDPDAWRRR